MRKSQAPKTGLITQREIKKYLPHRSPILLLDDARDWTENTLTATMKITPKTRWFKGHFPGQPTLPGVVMVEAMAQTAALHVGYGQQLPATKTIYYFLSIENTRFRQAVTKPCQLVLYVQQANRKGDYYKYTGKAYMDIDPANAATAPAKALVAEATFMAKLVVKQG
jgi:3-hydroxyacyl-[acyl-carrier-protein] dehydratase